MIIKTITVINIHKIIYILLTDHRTMKNFKCIKKNLRIWDSICILQKMLTS